MILRVLPDTHPRLRKICLPADPTKAHHSTLGRRLLETVDAHKALGIAANQVFPGDLIRIIAIDTPQYRGVMFNPEITFKSEDLITFKEGCLSASEEVEVTRANTITVIFQNIANINKELTLSGLSAVVVQHECDHLVGIMITDYLKKE